jgi:hypothetical protein
MEITDKTRSFFLQRHYAIPVELILNIRDRQRKYIHIGDILYAFATMKEVDTKLVLTEEEYTVIDDVYRQVCINNMR